MLLTANPQIQLPMNDPNRNALCDVIRECAFGLHSYLRHGHVEKVYENGLRHRLEKRGIMVNQQVALSVLDEDGFPLGDFYADLLVEGQIVVELKACRSVVDEHVAQLLGYLRSSRKRIGLLVNFGTPKLHVKRYLLDQ